MKKKKIVAHKTSAPKLIQRDTATTTPPAKNQLEQALAKAKVAQQIKQITTDASSKAKEFAPQSGTEQKPLNLEKPSPEPKQELLHQLKDVTDATVSGGQSEKESEPNASSEKDSDVVEKAAPLSSENKSQALSSSKTDEPHLARSKATAFSGQGRSDRSSQSETISKDKAGSDNLVVYQRAGRIRESVPLRNLIDLSSDLGSGKAMMSAGDERMLKGWISSKASNEHELREPPTRKNKSTLFNKIRSRNRSKQHFD